MPPVASNAARDEARRAAEAEAAALREMLNRPRRCALPSRKRLPRLCRARTSRPARPPPRPLAPPRRTPSRALPVRRRPSRRPKSPRPGPTTPPARSRQAAPASRDGWRAGGGRWNPAAVAVATSRTIAATSRRREFIAREVHVPETISVADLAQDVRQGRGSHQAPDEAGPDGHHQPGAGPGNGHDRGRGTGPRRHRRQAGRSGSLPGRIGHRVGIRATAARAGRPSWATSTTARPRCWTTSAAPRSPRAAASRSTSALPRRNRARHGHLPRHPGPRGVHRHARPWRQGHRHRHPGVRGGRRRDAADPRSHPPCEGRRRAHGRGHDQDRQAQRQPRPRQAGTGRRGSGAGRIRRRAPCPPRLAKASTICSRTSCCKPKCWN